MRASVDSGLPAEALANQVYRAIQQQDLYVLPNFVDEGSQAIAQGIATGRASGINNYPDLFTPLFTE